MKDLLLQLHQFLHLPDEPRLDVGLGKKFLHCRSFANGFIHDPLPFAGGFIEHCHQFRQRPLVKVFGESESVATVFERANRLLEGFLVSLADAHHLADGAHLCAEFVDRPFEFLEGPAGELHDDIVAGGGVFFQGAVTPVWNLVERETARQFGRDERDGEAGGLGGKGRGA